MTSSLRIVADENIPSAVEAFSQFGEVALARGRDLHARDLQDADVLFVRSVTRVDAELLAGTPVQFVGTATIGTEHLDLEFLRASGIGFAAAPGSNARSVAEYVFAAILEFVVQERTALKGRTLGVVGHGAIGSRVAAMGAALGLRVLVSDPPLERAGKLPRATPLDDLLAASDFVTLHVPLTTEGPDATHRMIGERELFILRPGTLLINAARGGVLDNKSADVRAEDIGAALILDVFEGEPMPARSLIRSTLLSTPHIAGYSFEGKLNGTAMMADALARHLGRENNWSPDFSPPEGNDISLPAAPTLEENLLAAVRTAYCIREDDARLRAGLHFSNATWAQHFDALRRNYPVRREFGSYRVHPGSADPGLANALRALGFQVAEA